MSSISGFGSVQGQQQQYLLKNKGLKQPESQNTLVEQQAAQALLSQLQASQALSQQGSQPALGTEGVQATKETIAPGALSLQELQGRMQAGSLRLAAATPEANVEQQNKIQAEVGKVVQAVLHNPFANK